ncbi:MAG: hypothetical protein V1820_06490 [archaeon]
MPSEGYRRYAGLEENPTVSKVMGKLAKLKAPGMQALEPSRVEAADLSLEGAIPTEFEITYAKKGTYENPALVSAEGIPADSLDDPKYSWTGLSVAIELGGTALPDELENGLCQEFCKARGYSVVAKNGGKKHFSVEFNGKPSVDILFEKGVVTTKSFCQPGYADKIILRDLCRGLHALSESYKELAPS